MEHPIQPILFQSKSFIDPNYIRNMQPHQHSSLEISYLLSGEMILEFYSHETKKMEMTHIFPKQFFIIAPNCPHSVNFSPPIMSIGLEFICNNGDIMEYLKNSAYLKSLPLASTLLEKFQDILIFNDTQNIAHLLNSFKNYTQTNKKDIFWESSYELEIKRLLIETLKCTNESHKLSGANIYIRKASSFIESNYMYTINAKDVANHSGISVVYLQKMFRENLNTSVNAFINKTRIDKAKQLIAASNFSLKKISQNIGYNSVQSFIQNFKKLTGHTPTEYKQVEIHNDNLHLFIEHKNYSEQKI